VKRMRCGRTALQFLVLNHISSERLTAIRHVLPPFDFQDTSLNFRCDCGAAMFSTRVEPSQIRLGESLRVPLSSVRHAIAGGTDVEGDGSGFDGLAKECVT